MQIDGEIRYVSCADCHQAFYAEKLRQARVQLPTSGAAGHSRNGDPNSTTDGPHPDADPQAALMHCLSTNNGGDVWYDYELVRAALCRALQDSKAAHMRHHATFAAASVQLQQLQQQQQQHAVLMQGGQVAETSAARPAACRRALQAAAQPLAPGLSRMLLYQAAPCSQPGALPKVLCGKSVFHFGAHSKGGGCDFLIQLTGNVLAALARRYTEVLS